MGFIRSSLVCPSKGVVDVPLSPLVTGPAPSSVVHRGAANLPPAEFKLKGQATAADSMLLVYRHDQPLYLTRQDTYSVDQVIRAARKRFSDDALARLVDVTGEPVAPDTNWHTQPNAPGIVLVMRPENEERFMFPAFQINDEVPVVANGRSVRVRTLSVKPRIFELQNFLSPEECEHMIKRAKEIEMVESMVGGSTAASVKSDVRTSRQTWIGSSQNNDDEVFLRVRQRVLALTRMPEDLAEDTQVVSYAPDAHYYGHHDYTEGHTLPDNPYYSQGGNRILTVLYYLNDVPEGGETMFPYANSSITPNQKKWHELNNHEACIGEGLRVKPVKGAAVLFYNLLPESHMDGVGDELTLHAGCDPINGNTKWLANQWVRNKRVDVNGKMHLYDEHW